MSIVTVSERQLFKRCRRSWDYLSHNRQSLQAIGAPATALFVGTIVHEGLGAQAKGEDVEASLPLWLAAQEQKLRKQYVEVVGADWSLEEEERFQEAAERATAVVFHYLDHWGWENPLEDQGLTYVPNGVEISFKVPIPGTDGELAGTFDGITTDPEGRIWLIDHKTYTQKPSQDAYELNDQFHLYLWAAQQLFSEPVAGILYDGIRSKPPSRPAVLKDGTRLSRAMIDTTAVVYRDTIIEHGFDPKDYADLLSSLTERDRKNSSFFTRWPIPLIQSAVDSFAAQLPLEYEDMQDPHLYPNFRWEGCWDCRVQNLCKAEQCGGDLEWIIKSQYRKGTYGTIARLELTPQEVTSVEELATA